MAERTFSRIIGKVTSDITGNNRISNNLDRQINTRLLLQRREKMYRPKKFNRVRFSLKPTCILSARIRTCSRAHACSAHVRAREPVCEGGTGGAVDLPGAKRQWEKEAEERRLLEALFRWPTLRLSLTIVSRRVRGSTGTSHGCICVSVFLVDMCCVARL